MNTVEWDALDGHFSGESVTAPAGDPKVIDQVREIWDAAGLVTPAVAPDVDDGWRRLEEKMGRASKPVLKMERIRAPRVWPWVLAATVVLAIGALGVERLTRKEVVIARAPERVFATRKAQRADVYLSDGTRVLLNVDSRLRVPAEFGKGMREVLLEGEAYFDVVHDSLRPFRVRTAGGVVEDIGTAFAVAQYAGSGMSVAVRSGLVKIGATMLRARDAARVDTAGRVTVRHNVDVESEMAWTGGRLVFDRLPLGEVIPKMARWFDADLRLDSALVNVRYTAAFRNEPIEQVMELMAKSLGASVVREGDRLGDTGEGEIAAKR